MVDKDLTTMQTVMAYGGMIITWATGEVGRVMVAGSAGGGLRWMMSQKRRLRDGAIAVVAGAICARYTWPLTLKLIEAVVGDMGSAPDVIGLAAFTAGLVGMSAAKMLIVIVEVRARKLGVSKDG